MFEVEYKGGNALTIVSKKLSIAVDPNVSLLGLKNPKLQDWTQLLTEHRFGVESPDARLIIDSPGEYEVGDFTIRGVAASRFIDDEKSEQLSTMYRLEQDDISIAVVGNVGPQLSEEQLEALGVVDVLILPVGGGGTLDATNAVKLVRSIEPKVVIPVHFASSGVSYEVPQDTIDTFVSELGAPVEETAKLKLKSASLPQVMTTYKLSRS